MKNWWAMACVVFLGCILPQIKVGFRLWQCICACIQRWPAVVMPDSCVTARGYLCWAPTALASSPVQLPYVASVDVEMRKEAEYINSISEAQACIYILYCPTVLSVSQGGFHSAKLNVVYCLFWQRLSLLITGATECRMLTFFWLISVIAAH